jgi:hypothetical protein
MTEPRIIANKIKTPDGTVLQSFHRHDYKEYTDANGCTYMVDGGNDYLRRNVIDNAPYEELSVYSDAPFETIRKELNWGTRGKDGNQPLEWKPLCDLHTDHIHAILETQTHIGSWLIEMFDQELEYR